MDILVIILGVIGFPFVFHTQFKDKPQAYIRIVRTMYIINTICLLSCGINYFFDKFYLESVFADASLTWLYHVLIFLGGLIVVLRMFFIPYIPFIIWAILYIKYLHDTGKPQRETTLFIILTTLSIVGCIFMELSFYNTLAPAFSI